jgi:hypothetical protein
VPRSATSLDLVITGYATTRTLQKLDFQFTGAGLQTTSLSADVEPAFSGWFQGANSRAFGGQFVATVTINSTTDISAVQSISVTATNAKGSSPPATANTR